MPTECTCDPRGSVMCDYQTGACLCKPNVIGENCDQCAVSNYSLGAFVHKGRSMLFVFAIIVICNYVVVLGWSLWLWSCWRL